jgi:gliding motility-associated-like protein
MPPVADAGSDRELAARFETTMCAKLGPVESGVWSVISGTGVFKDLNSPNSKVYDLSLGDNVFEWKVSNGYCPEDSDQVTIRVNDFVIPTVITPNDDGKNDYFQVSGIEYMTSSELVVLNRWGEEVYRAAPYDNNWTGIDRKGKELPEGTYFIVLKLGDSDIRKGYVMIIR